jgi:hypothetical protein
MKGFPMLENFTTASTNIPNRPDTIIVEIAANEINIYIQEQATGIKRVPTNSEFFLTSNFILTNLKNMLE